jgi:hypothetical protein
MTYVRAGLSLVVGFGLAGGLVVATSPAVRTALMSRLPISGQPEEPTVLVDGWWSGDWAEGGCDQAKIWMEGARKLINEIGCEAANICPKMMPRYTACMTAHDPKDLAHSFEDEVMTQFAINPNCKGAQITRYVGPVQALEKMEVLGSKRWKLTINYEVGETTQRWFLLNYSDFKSYQADGGTPDKIAADMCAIVMGHGGMVRD